MRRSLPLAVASILLLTSCAAESEPRSTPSSAPSTPAAAGALQPVGEPTVLATGLAAPWSIVRLGTSDSSLISERDSGTVVERLPSGSLRHAGVVPGVVHAGEGGLLGIAVHQESTSAKRWLYAYLTTATDNRVLRMPLTGASGSYRLGAATPILTGLAKAQNHDGGRIAFGPDGMLYATVGDAGKPSRAQDPASLNGKILRMTPTGAVPTRQPDHRIAGLFPRPPQLPGHRLGCGRSALGLGVRPEHLGRVQPDRAGGQLRLAHRRRHRIEERVRRSAVPVAHL